MVARHGRIRVLTRRGRIRGVDALREGVDASREDVDASREDRATRHGWVGSHLRKRGSWYSESPAFVHTPYCIM